VRDAALIAALAALPPWRAPGTDSRGHSDPRTEAPTEEVVVVGKHEGPRLWRVRKADHVLWILGTVSPLPKRMIWQSDRRADVLQDTQEVVPGWPAVASARILHRTAPVHSVAQDSEDPGSHAAAGSAPPQLYARFSALKSRYAPNDERLEELRPMLAAERLLEKVLDASD